MTNTRSRHSNPPKPQYLEIVGIPGHPENDQKTWKHFWSIYMVLSISKRFQMWGYNEIWPTRKANANLPTLWNVTGSSLLGQQAWVFLFGNLVKSGRTDAHFNSSVKDQ